MANKGSFVPGDPRAGRPKGTPNKTGRDARLLAQSLVTDPEYLEKLKQRLIDGKLGQTASKFPLRWWIINSTLSRGDQLDKPSGPYNGRMRLSM